MAECGANIHRAEGDLLHTFRPLLQSGCKTSARLFVPERIDWLRGSYRVCPDQAGRAFPPPRARKSNFDLGARTDFV
jgi:hypothetical protein